MAAKRSKRRSHHGTRGFLNPGYGPWRQPHWGLLAPFFARRIAASVLGAVNGSPPSTVSDAVAQLRAAGEDPASVTWLGHATLFVRIGTVRFLTDPVWAPRAGVGPFGARRLVESPIRPAELPPVDFVVVSHNHYDHMDTAALAQLARRGARIFVPLENRETLAAHGIRDVVELDWWETATYKDLLITCVPARHWSRRGLFDTNRALWSGWGISSQTRRFYFAGDTAAFDGFAKIGETLGPIDLAAVPIGAYEPASIMASSHLDPEQAITALEALRARHGVAVHYGTFDLSDEPIDEPPRRFLRASLAAGRGPSRDWVLHVGETRGW